MQLRRPLEVAILSVALATGLVPARVMGQAAQVRVVAAGPATIHVTIRGRGEPILFVPSRGRGVEDFEELSRALVAAGYQAILPQPRGIQGSSGPLDSLTYHDLAADVATTIQQLVPGPVIVLGHGFGGRVARTLAADYPRLVSRLILLGVAGPVHRSTGIAALTDRVFDPGSPSTERLEAVQRSFFANGHDARAWQDGWYLAAATAQRAADARTPLVDWWSGGSVPILAVQGSEDLVALPENARRLARDFPNRVRLVMLPAAGHAMLPEQPRLIIKAITSYLQTPR